MLKKLFNLSDAQSVLVKKHALNGVVSFFRYFFLLALSYVVLFQLIYMITYAIRPVADEYNPSIGWIPSEFTFKNFAVAIEALDYVKSGLNSVWIMLVAAMIEVFMCALVAYGFARFEFKGKNALFFLVLITIMVPTQMLVVPMYLNFKDFDILWIGQLIKNATAALGMNDGAGIDMRVNLLNTAATFYLPSLFAVGVRSGLFIFIYRKFFEGLPRELEEAAYVDGAGPLRTYISVILPSSGVVFLTVTIFSCIWHWNESYLSSMFLQQNPTLAVMLELFSESPIGGTDTRGAEMAACLLFVLPMLIVYMILQRKFVQSIDRVGIVG